jgi:hypothetical protein
MEMKLMEMKKFLDQSRDEEKSQNSSRFSEKGSAPIRSK